VRRARWGLPVAVLCLALGLLGSETAWVHAAQKGWVDPGALVQWLDWFPAMRLWAYAMLSTALLVLCLVAAPWRVAAPLRWAPLRAVGRISYGLYLYHLPIFRLVFAGREHPAWIGLAWGLAFLAAAVSYRYFEAPLLRRVRGLR